jgi:hypothetical protein
LKKILLYLNQFYACQFALWVVANGWIQALPFYRWSPEDIALFKQKVSEYSKVVGQFMSNINDNNVVGVHLFWEEFKLITLVVIVSM